MPERRFDRGEHIDPMKWRKQRLNPEGNAAQLRAELKKRREQHSREGEFLDVNPMVESGVFLNTVKKEKDESFTHVFPKNKGNPQVLQEAIDNMKKQLKYYERHLPAGSEERIFVYAQPNLTCFYARGKDGGIVKTTIQTFKIGEKEKRHFTSYFIKDGELAIEHMKEM